MSIILEWVTVILGIAIIVLLIPAVLLWSLNVMFHCNYIIDIKHLIATDFILMLLFGLLH